MLKLEGVFPALITPFTKDGELDEERLRSLVEFVAENGVAGVVPCGTTGESATLSYEEHERVIDIVVDCSKVPVVAGTGSNSTREAIELTKYAEDAGADAALLITPYYNKPNRRGLIEHFKAVADATELPLVLYNVPSRTGLNMTPDVVAELADVPNIVGIKEASGNISQVAKIIRATRDKDFVVLSGDDALTLPIMALGGKGVISVAANIVPREMSELVAAMLKGDYERARELHFRLMPLFEAMFLETNPIPVKKAAELLGLANGTLRLPLAELSEENEEKLRAVLRDLGLLK